MFGYTIKKFFINWIASVVFLLIIASASFGYNSLTNSFDIVSGFNTLVGMLGGAPALGAIVLVLAVLVAISYLIVFIGRRNWDGKTAQLIGLAVLMAVIVIVAAVVGLRWIPSMDAFASTLGVIVGTVVLVTIFAAIVTPRSKKVIVSATPAAVPVATAH